MSRLFRAAVVAALIFPASGVAVPAHADAVDLEAAKREGKVVWYTSLPIALSQRLAGLFEQRSGIKVELFRSGGSAILRRFLQEKDAGRVLADVLYTADPAATASLAAKDTFVAFRPKDFDRIADVAKDPQGRYYALRLNMITLFVRTDLVTPADVRESWTALAGGKYKGKVVISDPSFTAVQVSVVATLAKKLGWGYYGKLRDNDAMVVPGNRSEEHTSELQSHSF